MHSGGTVAEKRLETPAPASQQHRGTRMHTEDQDPCCPAPNSTWPVSSLSASWLLGCQARLRLYLLVPEQRVYLPGPFEASV